MSSVNPSESELERLRQLEREINQGSQQKAGSTQSSPMTGLMQTFMGWGKPLLTLLVIIACILTVGLTFRLLGEALKLTFIVGLGYLLYHYVVAPRLGLNKSTASTKSDSPPDL